MNIFISENYSTAWYYLLLRWQNHSHLNSCAPFFPYVPFNSRQSIGIQMHMRQKAVSWIKPGKLCIDSLGSGMKVYTVGQLHLQTAYGEQVSDQNGQHTELKICLRISLLFLSLYQAPASCYFYVAYQIFVKHLEFRPEEYII